MSSGEGRAWIGLELDGHTAVVIGGSSGIGAAVAGVLAEEGCDVGVTYRSSRDGAEQAAADVRAHGRRAWVVSLDLRRPESATAVADTLSAQMGGLDAVVLCAGHNVVTPFGRITVDEWNAVLEVNLGGALFALQAMAPMIRRGGAIVTVPAWRPTPGRRTTCTMRQPRPDW